MENPNDILSNKNVNENNQNNNNSYVLGVKRERENDDQNKNLTEFKKKKSEESAIQQTEIKQLSTPIQQGNVISHQQFYQPNYNVYANNANMINHHAAMQGVYGYAAQPPLYYYNQTAISSAIPSKI